MQKRTNNGIVHRWVTSILQRIIYVSSRSMWRRGNQMAILRSSFSVSLRFVVMGTSWNILSSLYLQKGNSVLLHVEGFRHYLYIAAPVGFHPEDVKPYTNFLEQRFGTHERMIHSVNLAQKENLYGFQGNLKSWYIKITATEPKYIARLRNSLEKSIANYNYKGLWPSGDDGGIVTFDNIQYVLRFMIDTGVNSLPTY